MDTDEIDDIFIELVKEVLNEAVSEAVNAGKINIHIGFHNIDDEGRYSSSIVRPFVHITQAK